MSEPVSRCAWANGHPLLAAYHDAEWGVPVHEDRKHFEFITLDSAQAGLSWLAVLKKREGYRRAFADFDPAAVARFTGDDVERLLADPGIIRNRQKVTAAIGNARAFLAIQEELGSFDRYVWQFVGGRAIANRWTSPAEVPAVSPEAEAMSRDMRSRGFRFAGPVICYAYMQGAGLVNDHTLDCFRHLEVGG